MDQFVRHFFFSLNIEMDFAKFNYVNFFKDIQPKMDYSKMTEEELIAELKKSDDYNKLVFPNSWYAKHDLPMKECQNMKEFIKESAWMKTSRHWYVEKKDIPAKPGGNRPVLEAPEVPAITMIQNSFSDAPTNQTEPSNLLTNSE